MIKEQIRRIGELGDIFDGPHATPEKTSEGPYFLSISSLEKGFLHLERSAHLDDSDFKKWTRRVTPQKDDLLFSYETRLGEAALMPDGIKACLGRRMALLRPNKDLVDPSFLLYSYLSPAFQNTIISNTITGATVDRISLNEFPDFPIWIPPLTTQKKIATVLSTLDAKIELNHRINQELEGLAKLLYDYWFVQFDFPISAEQAAAMGDPTLQGKPYRQSGGKMTYNPTLKREIPEGWEVKPLSKIAPVSTATITPSSQPNSIFKLFSIPVFDETGTYFEATGSEIGSNKFVVTGNSILVSKLNPWFSRVIYPELGIEAVASTEFVVWKAKTSMKAFLFMVATSEHFRSFCTQGATGTSNSHKRVNPKVMMNYSIPYYEKTVKAYGEMVDSLLQAQLNNQKQNQELATLRDWLLPMLMNGQVTVAH
jgi:type I restriction enzyme S subunit